MQVRTLIASVATLGFGALTACGSNSAAEVIVKPGITAIDQSSALACDSDRLTLQTAIDNFTLLNVDPPAAESDLVPDWLRSESQLFDLVDGQVIPAAGSGCAAGTADPEVAAPATTAEDAMGVRQCSSRVKTLQIAIEAYYAMHGTSLVPTEQALVDEQLLRGLDDQHDVDPTGQVFAVPGAICEGLDPPTT